MSVLVERKQGNKKDHLINRRDLKEGRIVEKGKKRRNPFDSQGKKGGVLSRLVGNKKKRLSPMTFVQEKIGERRKKEGGTLCEVTARGEKFSSRLKKDAQVISSITGHEGKISKKKRNSNASGGRKIKS